MRTFAKRNSAPAVFVALIATVTLTGAARGEANDARKRPPGNAGLTRLDAAAATGTVIDSFDDTSTPWGKNLINRWRVPLGSDPWSRPGHAGTPWPSGGGIWEVPTPHGPGFRINVTDEMRVLSGGKLAFIADIGHLVGPVGSTEDWSGKAMFPAAGNPNGFPRKYPDWGVFFEFHSNRGVPLGMGIDTTDAPHRNTIWFSSHPFHGPKRKALAPAPLVYGRWYSWRIQLKWSSGSDGFIKWWLDGRLLADWTGPTLAASEVPYLQFGFYSAAQLRNEVIHAALRKGTSPPRPGPRKPSAWIGTAAVKVAANGSARVLLGCRATSGGCRGSITLERRAMARRTRVRSRHRLAVRLGSSIFRLRASERRRVPVRLSSRGLALLRARNLLSVRAVVVSRDASGHRTTAARLIVLRTQRWPR
jgi:Polysaccharide lyase